jgi:NADPH:quinone reductase-like Zn-dependent oxidoreductase
MVLEAALGIRRARGKIEGAHVIALASGNHEAFLRDFGADEFIDYTKRTITFVMVAFGL